MPQLDEPMTITLSPELSRRVREKITANGYQDAEELIAEGLNALPPWSPEIDAWIENEVIPDIEADERDPSGRRSSEQVRLALEAEYQRWVKAG